MTRWSAVSLTTGKCFRPGVVGIHLFTNGAVGGLMTTHPVVTVRDPYLQQDYKEPSHDKSRAVGYQLAARVLPRLAENTPAPADIAPIGIRARTIEIPVHNKTVSRGGVAGVDGSRTLTLEKTRTEVALITIGEASIACVPGEIYPEIVNGGIEHPPGADFDIEPLEVPPLRELMPGRIKFVFGLANDELGHMIPKSEWDVNPPYLYGAKGHAYGEINSCGPETGRIVHAALAELCREVKSAGNGR
ncbi:MAG: hypothetical protein MUF81_00040 [Verrucomicrobia bacterium]|nr:hypothetical protein [Verrucomicrobiota bacterium]